MRILIYDSTCILDHGHNYGALNSFSKHFKKISLKNIDVRVVICSKAVNQDMAGWGFRLKHVWGFEGLDEIPENPIKYAIDDLTNEINLLEIGDIIFFPNIDSVTLKAIESVEGLINKKKIKLKIRLISVMENEWPKKGVVGLNIELLKNISLKHEVFTETESYRYFLEGKGIKVSCSIPYPMLGMDNSSRKLEINRDIFCLKEDYENLNSCVPNIGYLGSAREDKGYYDILEILEDLNNIDGFKFNFFYQEMQSDTGMDSYGNSELSEKIIKYNEKLRSLKNTIPLIPKLESQDLEIVLDKMDLFILPYKSETYKLRGSAMLYESLWRRKPLVCWDDLGFSSDVDKFSFGLTAKRETGIFASCIVEANKMNAINTQKNFQRYFEFADESLKKLII